MRYTLLLFSMLSLATRVAGQAPLSDSSFVQAAKNQAVRSYERTMHKQEHVYEGNEYIPHDHRIKIHPFFPIDTLQPGSIAYNGVHYHDVPMLYDIVRDELAIQPPDGGYRVRLHTEKISAFSIGVHQFARIVGDSALGVRTGFYEVLHNGKVKVLAQRVKTVHEDISSGTYKADYLVKDRFYIQKEGAYHEVKTKGSVLSLFPDQSKALRKYLRANKLKFNDEQREAAITQATKRYEELTH
ncbi:hypothetical protein GO730_34025 [Spirosoma sp. HMF3257]|uniref:Uncharacterized protein n=1 Tax=Spirosoma telluris TaxID=2183553 RepID=A0A327NTH8_9BACT|nr:hypothetical protein [Spirosoma telluris]RAI77873.1 hypothetical protein HMF3257_33920 [Spirosoma telluris]